MTQVHRSFRPQDLRRGIVYDSGDGQGSSQAFTTQNQQGKSISQPLDYIQGPLQGLANQVYGLYTNTPGGSPIATPSTATQAGWQTMVERGAKGLGYGIDPAYHGLTADTLSGQYLDLGKNPYFQGALSASLAPATENFLNNILPGIKSTFASAGRAGSGMEQAQIEQALNSFNRATADASTKAGNEAYQFERGMQGNTLGMLPALNNIDWQNIAGIAQGGAGIDAYNQALKTGQMDYATKTGLALQALAPGGITSTSSSGSGTTWGTQNYPGGGLGSWLGGGLGLAGLGLQAYGILSDRRDKTDIEHLGDDPLTGLPMYSYRYRGDPKSYPKIVGPIAQDIEKRFPGMVREIGSHKVVMPVGGLM